MFAPGAMLSEWKARGKRAESAWKEGGGVSGFGRTTALMMPGPQAVDPSGTGERGAGLSESVKTAMLSLTDPTTISSLSLNRLGDEHETHDICDRVKHMHADSERDFL
jgi:hypothetical protein